jgi:hypothetical protein
VPVILGNIKNFEPGAGERRFERGRQEAWTKEQELLERLRGPQAAHGRLIWKEWSDRRPRRGARHLRTHPSAPAQGVGVGSAPGVAAEAAAQG